MPHPCPHHCPPEGAKGGLVLAAAGVAVVVIIARAAEHAARAAEHVAVDVLEVAAISLGSAAAVGVLTAVTVLAVRSLRRSHRALAAGVTGAQPLSAPQRLAIEAPRSSLADVKALAAEHGYDVVLRGEVEKGS